MRGVVSTKPGLMSAYDLFQCSVLFHCFIIFVLSPALHNIFSYSCGTILPGFAESAIKH